LANATIKWLPGGLTFIGTDSEKHSVVLSPVSEGTGMKPSDLLLVAVGSCTAVDVVGILEKKRTPLSSLEIEVTGEQDADPPWTYRRVHVHYKLRGNGLTTKAVEQAILLSEEKYCSVASTIRGVAELSNSYEILTD